MAYYLQRERYINAPMAKDSICFFEVETAHSQSEIPPFDAEPDFFYHESGEWAGAVDILRRGHFLIWWQMSPLVDQPLASETFQLKKLVYDSISGWSWQDLSSQSTHLYPTNAMGFAIVDHALTEPLTVALWQVGSVPVTLFHLKDTGMVPLKARIMFYGLSEDDGDFSRIWERLEELEANCCQFDLGDLQERILALEAGNDQQDERILNLQDDFDDFELEFEYLAEPSEIYLFDCDYPLTGLSVYCIRNGNVYHFHGGKTGLARDRFNIKTYNASNPLTKPYLLTRNQFPALNASENLFYPFDYYNHPNPQVGWLWIKDDVGGYILDFLYADQTGIYIKHENSKVNIETGGLLEFTMHIVLSP